MVCKVLGGHVKTFSEQNHSHQPRNDYAAHLENRHTFLLAPSDNNILIEGLGFRAWCNEFSGPRPFAAPESSRTGPSTQ